MTTLANSTAEALGYAVSQRLGDDPAERESGGPTDVSRAAASGPLDQRPERIEVRRPTFDVRYVLRDFNGMGTDDDFGAGTHGKINRAPNPSNLRGDSFDNSPTIDRGYVGRWDEGAALPAGIAGSGGI